MSSNSGSGITSILPQNIFSTVNNFISNNKTLDFLMNRGSYDIPYGFMGIATIAAGTFTYVTYTDYANEISSGISETLDTVQSSELFIPSTEQTDEEPLFPTVDEPQQDEIVNDDIILEEDSSNKEPDQEEKNDEPQVKEEEPNAPPEENDKQEEPGEKYKMGGKSKKRRKKKNKTKKKRQN